MASVQDSAKNAYSKIEGSIKSNPRRASIYVGLFILFLLSFFVQVDPPHVALSGEPIFSNGPAWLTNSVVTTLVVDLILIGLAALATTGMKLVPQGWQNFVELVVEGMYNLSENVAGKDARRYFPWTMTIFLFVILSNWSGLIPGVGSIGIYQTPAHGEEIHEEDGEATEAEHSFVWENQLAMADGNLVLSDSNSIEASPVSAEEEGHAKFVPLFRAPSADLNVTFALAIITIFMVQVWGVKALGGKYFKKFFNAEGEGFMKGINAFVGILELVSEFSRIIAFGFRLFGNIFAGEIVLATMAFLIAFLLPVPFSSWNSLWALYRPWSS